MAFKRYLDIYILNQELNLILYEDIKSISSFFILYNTMKHVIKDEKNNKNIEFIE